MLGKSLQAAVAGQSSSAYIEDVFSTYLYTGTGSTQTITNGIDLDGEGGLVWIKNRSVAESHRLFDTVRGATNSLRTNGTNEQITYTDSLTAFNADGFDLGAGSGSIGTNTASSTYASWTFRKAPKFFDVVTYTGNGVSGRAIPHNLGSAPGFIAVKILSSADNWECYHRGVTFNSANVLWLNSQNALTTGVARFTSQPNDSNFFVGSDSGVNGSGQTYVAYLFAHNAGGFGNSGEENVISCGSYTGNGGTQDIELGYEPQFVIIKRAVGGTGQWFIEDTIRAMDLTGSGYLYANLSSEEQVFPTTPTVAPTATGFSLLLSGSGYNASGSTYIYIAIRRGPMKTPEVGTEVFSPIATSGSTGTTHTIGFPLDLQMSNYRTGSFTYVSDRLRGVDSTTNETAYPFLKTSATDAEATSLAFTRNVNNTSFQTPSFFDGTTQIYWNFRRAPGFFDVVCYTGTGSARTVSHNLGVAPELIIVKSRTTAGANWMVYSATIGASSYLALNTAYAGSGSSAAYWNSTSPTSSVFSIGTDTDVNNSGSTYVAYLFASCPGVSKIGSYTGNGTSQTIDCGFSNGARFVLIKQTTDTQNDWWVWDTERGIVSANDPVLALNTTSAENTSYDSIDPDSSGFIVVNNGYTEINVSGRSYIYLAIA